MGLIKNIKEKMASKAKPGTKQYCWNMAKRICGHHVKYVTEEKNGTHEVIGRSGALNIKNDELLVFASADVLMRCKVEEMQAWELQSHDGVVITAPDLEHGGAVRTVIVHYVYYR